MDRRPTMRLSSKRMAFRGVSPGEGLNEVHVPTGREVVSVVCSSPPACRGLPRCKGQGAEVLLEVPWQAGHADGKGPPEELRECRSVAGGAFRRVLSFLVCAFIPLDALVPVGPPEGELEAGKTTAQLTHSSVKQISKVSPWGRST